MAVVINGDGVVDVGGNASSAAKVRLYEDSDNGTNYVDLLAPASVASDRTITLPDATTTLVGTDATQTLTNKTIQGGTVQSGTAQASTSGTSIDFTGIPSWVKRITVMFSGVSTSGTSSYLLQLGDSGGIENTGYTSLSITTNDNGGSLGVSSTAGYAWFSNLASFVQSGMFILTNESGNTWVCMHQGYLQNANDVHGGGTKTLSDTLTQVRITTVNGTNTFDAGSINILYE
jgi:hypothetical protein